MAGLDSRHVTWGHLQYYDSQIKKYVDDLVNALDNSTVTPEELQEVEKQVAAIQAEVAANKATIVLLNDGLKTQTSRVNELFELDKETAEKIASIESKIESLATKEELQKELGTVKQDLPKILEELKDLEEALERDHETLHEVLTSLKDFATKDYVDTKIDSIVVPTKVSDLVNDTRYATEAYVEQKIAAAELADKEVDLTGYYTKSESDLKFADKETVDRVVPTLQNDVAQLFEYTQKDHDKLEDLEVALEKTVDREYLDEAIANIPQPDLSDYYTKEEVEDLIPEVSEFITSSEFEKALVNLATEAEVSSLIQEVANVQEQLDEKANLEDIPSLKGYATEEYVKTAIAEAELSGKDVDLSAYYTKSETEAVVKAAVDAINVPDVSNLATKEELEAVQNVAGSNSVKLFAIESDLVDINAKLDTIPSIEGLATETYVDEKFAEIVVPDVSEFATKEELKEAINNIEHPTVDLSDYYTKAEVDEAIANVEHPTVDLEGYATEAWVNEQGFLKEHQDLSDYAKKSELPTDYLTASDIENKADKDELTSLATKQEVASVEEKIPNVSNFATKDEVPVRVSELENDLGYLRSSDIENKAEKSELNALGDRVNDLITTVDNKANTSDLASLATKQELEEYAKKSDIPSDYVTTEQLDTKADKSDLDGVATQEWVTAELAKIDPTIPSEYITETELEEKGYITESALSGYAKIEDIPTDYLTSSDIENKVDRSELEDYAKKSDIPDVTGFATKDEVTAVENKIPSIEGLASTDYVDQAIANIPETDVSNLATKSELEAVEAKIPTDYLTTIPEEYVTKTELDAEGFVKSLDGYATEQFVTDAISNIKHPDPDLSNYYTKDETTSAINDAIDGIEIPEVDLAPYATKAQVAEQVATKADNVPFTTDMFVTSELGNFAYGDNLNGLSVTTILTKLLGLQATIVPDEPGEPDVPEEPKTLVDKIIAEEIPMYSVSVNGELVPIAFHMIDGNTEPTESGFYVINDASGNRVAAGYQDLQVENDEIYYVIALPKEIDYNTMIDVQTYDPDEKIWVDARIDLTSDPDVVAACCDEAGIDITHIDTNKYTVWVQEDICTGSIIRYRIVEEN